MTTSVNSSTGLYETQVREALICHTLPVQAIEDLRAYGVPDEHMFLVITSLLKYADELPVHLTWPLASQKQAYPMSKRAIWRLIRPE